MEKFHISHGYGLMSYLLDFDYSESVRVRDEKGVVIWKVGALAICYLFVPSVAKLLFPAFLQIGVLDKMTSYTTEFK